jgi:hypothetical protein
MKAYFYESFSKDEGSFNFGNFDYGNVAFK